MLQIYTENDMQHVLDTVGGLCIKLFPNNPMLFSSWKSIETWTFVLMREKKQRRGFLQKSLRFDKNCAFKMNAENKAKSWSAISIINTIKTKVFRKILNIFFLAPLSCYSRDTKSSLHWMSNFAFFVFTRLIVLRC